MARWNPENYEMVKSRKLRLRGDHPNAVIHPELVSDPQESGRFVMMRALIWKEQADCQAGKPPDSIGSVFPNTTLLRSVIVATLFP